MKKAVRYTKYIGSATTRKDKAVWQDHFDRLNNLRIRLQLADENSAGSIPRTTTPWSEILSRSRRVLYYWQARLRKVKAKVIIIPVTEEFLQLGEDLGIDDIGLDHEGYIQDQCDWAYQKVKENKKIAQQLRDTFLDELAEHYALVKDITKE